MNVSLDAEKAFANIQHNLLIKVLERSGVQGSQQTVKAKYSKPVANNKLKGKKLEEIPLISEPKQGCTLS